MVVTLVTLELGVASPGAASAAAWAAPAGRRPVVAFSGQADGQDQVWTARLDGTVVQRFGHPEGYGETWTTAGGGLVAVTKHNLEDFFSSNVHLFGVRTGAERTVIKDARFPLIVGDGGGIVFLPDNNGRRTSKDRDPSVNSVWYRDLGTGDEVRLLRFRDPDLWVSQLAASPTGDLVAATQGNDTYLFKWNIVLVRPNGRGRRSLTSDDRSLSPSFSRDGRTVAMEKVGGKPCGGSLATVRVGGGGLNRFYRNSCDVRLTRPVWVGPHRVVAQWREVVDLDQGFSVPRGLVLVDTETGQVSEPIVEGAVTSFASSRELRIVVYRTLKGFLGVHDLRTEETTPIPGGRTLPGTYVHVDGALELSP
jgi:hypothetical protein